MNLGKLIIETHVRVSTVFGFLGKGSTDVKLEANSIEEMQELVELTNKLRINVVLK